MKVEFTNCREGKVRLETEVSEFDGELSKEVN